MKPSDVLKHFISKTAIAEAMDISPQAVQQWFEKDVVPIGRQYQIQVITDGQLTIDDNCKDSARSA